MSTSLFLSEETGLNRPVHFLSADMSIVLKKIFEKLRAVAFCCHAY